MQQSQTAPSPGGRGELPVGPFRNWLRGFVARHETPQEAATALGEHDRTLSRVLVEHRTVHLPLVDRMLVAAGESPQLLNELYPLDDTGTVQS